ncbi:MAG: hypothetical protein J0M08_14200 [Bacteroidetes bacterium]|nr:hypothetical protein [Bacteroidota bacterium]
MKHFLEHNNITVSHDTLLPNGLIIKKGSKVNTISSQGDFNGFRMRVPPAEFEALMLFNAIDSAQQAQLLKNEIKIIQSTFDGMKEIETSEDNMSIFFNMCQHAMAATTFSISALESWANRSFLLHGRIGNEYMKLNIQRPNKPEREVSADAIALDQQIPIRVKIFQLIPQIFNVIPLKTHSKLRNSISELVDERNIVMHMQAKLKISDNELDRISYSIKLLKTDATKSPINVLKYLNYVYKQSKINPPSWLEIAEKNLRIR